MAGNKSVNLFLLGNNEDAKKKILQIDEAADKLKESHPELAISIDNAVAQEKLRLMKEAIHEVATAAEETGAKLDEVLAPKEPIEIRVNSAEAQKKLDAIKLNAEELRKLNPRIIPIVDDAEASAKLAVLRGEIRSEEHTSEL